MQRAIGNDRARARGREPADLLLHARGPGQGRGRRVVLARARRDAGDRRRVGLRQERHRALPHAPGLRSAGPHRRRLHPPRRRRPDGARRGRHARHPRQPDLDGLPGAHDLAQSGHDHRPADRRGADPASGACRSKAALNAGHRDAAAGRHPRAASSASRNTRTSSRAACASAP